MRQCLHLPSVLCIFLLYPVVFGIYLDGQWVYIPQANNIKGVTVKTERLEQTSLNLSGVVEPEKRGPLRLWCWKLYQRKPSHSAFRAWSIQQTARNYVIFIDLYLHALHPMVFESSSANGVKGENASAHHRAHIPWSNLETQIDLNMHVFVGKNM